MGILDDISSGLGDIGGIFGESPADRQDRLLNNEFRGVGGAQDFTSGAIPGLQGQAQGLGQQFGAQNALGPAAGQQQALIGQLQNQFAGQGPGQDIARLQAQQQADRGIQQQLALQAGNRGSGAVLGGRTAANNAAGITGQAANTAVLGGLQAQQQAGGLLGQQLQGAQQNQLGQAGLRQQGQLSALQQQLQLAQLQQRGQQAQQDARTRRFGAIAGVNPNQQTSQQLGAGLLQGLGAAAAGTG